MAVPSGQPPQRRATESLDDYIPDDFGDFDGLLTNYDLERPYGKPAGKNGTEELGIDKTVSVEKAPREPRVKLDSSRLLSEKGIPALRQRARVLKLKGKGHEFSDASRLLSMYQLWLDDLFPKARFADALAMVEKEGHKATMHKVRMEWINETKPKDIEDGNADKVAQQMPDQIEQHEQHSQQRNQASSTNGEHTDLALEDLFDEDLYVASSFNQVEQNQITEDVPDENELDALMAEAAGMHENLDDCPPPPPRAGPPADDFDDLDALIAEVEAAQ